jgi:hypothetical protein
MSTELSTPDPAAAWRRRQASLVRWLKILMFGWVVAFVVMIALAADAMETHVEPRWVWASAGRYEHLLEALDAHRPRWTNPKVIAGILLEKPEAAVVNWIMGVAPVSAAHFLVTDNHELSDHHELSFALYPATASNAEWWAQEKRYRPPEGGPPKPDFVVRVSRSLDPGHHSVVFPEAFQALDEILVVFSTKNQAIEPWVGGFGPFCLLIARPRMNDVEVAPLDWWNEDSRFRPHSDIERLFRDPVTGRLFGDGSHLRPFVLKEGARELERWLR